MRLQAYKRYLDDCLEIPTKVGDGYFKTININPREKTISKILEIARLDVDGLFHSEFISLYEYAKGISLK